MYPEEMIAPMREEVRNLGFTELKTAEDADNALSQKSGTALVFVNSVCGCAAGMARPGLAMALNNTNHKPDNLYTVFAGNDKDATDKARSYFSGFPPSSPSMGLLKDGQIVSMIQRMDIEGHSAEEVSEKLVEAFNTYCQ